MKTEHALEAKLVAISLDLRIESDFAFRFASHYFAVNESPWSLPPYPYVAPRERLVHAVALALYYGAYCRGRENKVNIVPDDLVRDHEFIEGLSAANQTLRTIEQGWNLVHREADDTVHVSKAGRFRIAPPGQFQSTSSTGTDSCAESLISLPVLREDRDWLPMFYLAHSEMLPNQCDDLDNVRFYFHCDQHSVLDVMRSVTGTLNRYQVPFRLKCLDHPRLYGRSDALVLYVEKRYVQFVARCLMSLSDGAAFQLSDPVPLFSKRLVQGIGIAEDPGDGQSFGQQRTRLLAEALLDAHDADCLHDDGVLAHIERRFKEAGLDLRRPHLNAGSVDWYTIPGQLAAVS